MGDGEEEGTFRRLKAKREDACPWENIPCVHEGGPSTFAACKGGLMDWDASCAWP